MQLSPVVMESILLVSVLLVGVAGVILVIWGLWLLIRKILGKTIASVLLAIFLILLVGAGSVFYDMAIHLDERLEELNQPIKE